MAKMIAADVQIGGTPIQQFSSFELTQKIFAHHQFRLTCPAEAIEAVQGSLLARSKNLMGETITLNITDVNGVPGANFRFTGLVSSIEAVRYSGHVGDVVISGYSPTIVMDNGPHCNSWEKKALSNMAKDVLGHFSSYIKNPQVNPAYGETFSYTVQYKETAWQFLSRMASTYGEWLYYNGQQLVFGQPKGKTANLLFGRELSSFVMGLEVRPPNFSQLARDYVNDQLYQSTPQGVEQKAGLNELGKFVYGKSKTFFAAQPKSWNNRFLTSKKQLDDATNFNAASQGASMVVLTGSSNSEAVQLGNKVNIRSQNSFTAQDEEYGDYTVTEVTHHFNSEGDYQNNFRAVPGSVKVPPVQPVPEPGIETQSGIVTDNHDPQGLGRVRVRLHWMKGSQKTPWIRVTSPHGGGGKGMFFIPETGEEVIVGFEGDSAIKPYVIGTVYHGKANSTFGNGGNDVKALQTRSGNKIVMNDKDGSLHMQDGKGNEVLIDGAGNVKVNSSASIVMTTGESKIEMKADGTINITGKNVTVKGTDTYTSDTKAHTAKATETYTLKGKENKINGTNNTITGKNHITGGDTKIDGGNVFIN